MVAKNEADRQTAGWPAGRRLAWTALFVAILSWSSMLQPPPQPEVLPWVGSLEA